MDRQRIDDGSLSVADIVQQANNFEYDSHVPLRRWLRSADTMQKEARIYEREGNDQLTYLLLYRHATLILEKLPKHPEAKIRQYAKALADAERIVHRDLARLEELRPRINRRHAKYVEALKRRDSSGHVRSPSKQGSNLTRSLSKLSLHSRKDSDSNLFRRKQALDAAENRDLAARLAQREIRRRDAARRSVRQAGISEEEEQERRVGGVWSDWEVELAKGDPPEDISQIILETGRRRDEAMRPRMTEGSPLEPHNHLHFPMPFAYPPVPQTSSPGVWKNSAHGNWDGPTETSPRTARREPLEKPIPIPFAPEPTRIGLPPRPPKLPPKEFEVQKEHLPPPVPEKILLESDVSESLPRSESTASPQHDLNSRDYTFKPTAFLENGTPLRTIWLPPDLRHRFLKIAEPNTKKNLETCGILCGTLISNALFISKLVIPEQESTSDTCETVNESALFDYCDSEDLMMLGWIHTHPTQTCFMSSRDLHTHCGYQVMLPESIAIVCAPSKEPSWGIYRLTDPPGMKTILNCSQTGLFHPHHLSDIYTDALKPGHVFECPGLPFEVVDLRPRRR